MSVRPLRRDAARNRETLLTAAKDVFAAQGIDVPVEEIARRAGLGVGTFYRHFPTKDALVDAIFEERLEEFGRAAEESLAEAAKEPALALFLERAVDLQARDRSFKDVVAAHLRGRSAPKAVRSRVVELVEQLVARAHEDGTLRRDVTAQDVPMLLWASGRVIEAAGDVAPDLGRRFLGLVLDGLRPDAATTLSAAPLTPAQLEQLVAGPAPSRRPAA